MSDPRLDAVVAHDAGDRFGLTEALCAVPSVFPHEGPLADAIEQRLRARAPKLEIVRFKNNVVARTNLGRPERVVIGGHTDTVPANNNQIPRRDGDVLHGLGTADMKGGLAIMLALAEWCTTNEPRHDLTLFWYEGEEVADEHNGLRAMFEERPGLVEGTFAILMEPTGAWVEAGCQGTLHLEAHFHGARAHTARPWMGTNAIHRAADVLARIAAHDPGTSVVDGLEFRESVQVVRVNGGVANNVVPDECSMIVNRRFAPCHTNDDAVAQLSALLAGADDIVQVNLSPAAAPNLTNPLVADFVTTLGVDVRPKLGWTDVARFASRGIPAVNFGPGDPTVAHTAQERVDRDEIERCYDGLVAFLG